jgi:LacI family transcriptional regulator
MMDDSPDLAILEQELVTSQADGMEIVAVGPRPRLSGVAFIGVDDRAMLRDLTMYLIQQGHRNLAWVGPLEGFTTGDRRFRGVLDAIAESHLQQPTIIRTGIDFHAGRRAALQMLQAPLPDAVLAFSDECALGVLMTLRSVGVAVPEQLSITGVDGTRESEFAGLTTVAIPMYELGAAAAARIIGRGDQRPLRTILSHQLMPRLTTSIREAIATVIR